LVFLTNAGEGALLVLHCRNRCRNLDLVNGWVLVRWGRVPLPSEK